MLTLGIDPSLTAYGWCVYDDNASPRFRIVASGHEGTLPDTVPVVRFMHFRALVAKLLRTYDVGLVGMESPAYSGGPFSEKHFGLMMFSLEEIFKSRKDCVLFDPTTLKYLIGNSKYGKSDMQKFVQLDTLCSGVIDNNEADAYCIAREASRFRLLASGKISPDSLTPNEQSTFLTKNRKKKRTDGRVVVQRTAHVFRANSRFFEFSRVPQGSVSLPDKASINPDLLSWLESHKDV